MYSNDQNVGINVYERYVSHTTHETKLNYRVFRLCIQGARLPTRRDLEGWLYIQLYVSRRRHWNIHLYRIVSLHCRRIIQIHDKESFKGKQNLFYWFFVTLSKFGNIFKKGSL